MVDFLSQIINGLAIGNVYALLAIGFALVFGVANLINFAQGSLFMLGGYFTFTGATIIGLPLPVAAIFGVALTTLVGIAMDRFCLRPIQRGPRIAPLLATLALAVIIDAAAELIWSPNTQGFPQSAGRPIVDDRQRLHLDGGSDYPRHRNNVHCLSNLVFKLYLDWPRGPGHRNGPGGGAADGRRRRRHADLDLWPCRSGRRCRRCLDRPVLSEHLADHGHSRSG